MISSVEQNVNSVQQFSAVNAFRANKNLKPAEERQEKEQALSGTETNSTPNLLNRIDVNDIRKYAEYVGEYNITDEDIKYGIIYGRSVIAEWLC